MNAIAINWHEVEEVIVGNGDKRTLALELFKLVMSFLIIPAILFMWQIDKRVERLQWQIISVKDAIIQHDLDTNQDVERLGYLHHSTLNCQTSSCHGYGIWKGKVGRSDPPHDGISPSSPPWPSRSISPSEPTSP